MLIIAVEPVSLLNQDSSNDPLPRVCASRVDPEFQTRNPVVIPAVSVITSGIFLLLVISLLVYAIVYFTIRKTKEHDTAVVATLSRDDLVTLQFNTCYSPSNHVIKEHNTIEQRNSCLVESTHSYVINSLGLSYAESNEKQYWQPASKEEDLKHQLKKMKVDEILKDNIK